MNFGSVYTGTLDISGLQSSPNNEPMALGSPAGSPTVSSLYHGGAQFLPSYLMGDPAGSPANNSRLWSLPGGSLSPKKNRGPATSFGNNLGQSPPKPLFSPLVQQSPITSRGYSRPTSADKHSGPPVQGLFDSIPAANHHLASFNGQTSSQTPTRQTTGLFNANPNLTNEPTPSRNHNQSLKFPTSPAQIDPFYTQGQNLTSSDELDDTWVTVFGFPPTAASYILQQFYHYGAILDHKLPPNGNWMHLRYQTKLQAKIALSKNGKVFGNNYMVGVTPCIDKAVISSSKNQCVTSPGKPSTPQNFVHKVVNDGGVMSSPFASRDYNVITSPNVPQKKTGMFTKAMDYVFGW